jgi:beta-mannanase
VPGSQEISQLPSFEASMGGHAPSILHVYTAFRAPVPTDTLNAISGAGAIPLIDWGCGHIPQIVSGQADRVIQNYAEALKSYGKPVFLRWYWEFNDNTPGSPSGCGGFDNPSGFVAAWQHIWTIFHSVGATNAAFVWCPGLKGKGGDPSTYYPGDQFVDWIAVDGYDRSYKGVGGTGFSSIFGAFYSEWVGHGKPMMVGETGAVGLQQAQYLQSIQTEAPTMPQFKAIVYFDSAGPAADWALQGAGITTFQSLLADPYFSFRPSA